MADPSASLRSVARLTGASPETVRPCVLSSRPLGSETVRVPPEEAQHAARPRMPQAYVSSQAGRDFLDWFTKTG